MFARYLLSKPEINLSFTKVLYTSKPFAVYQEEYLRKVFHCELIVSIYGFVECGPWAYSLPSKDFHSSKPYRDFIFGTDTMIAEIVDDDGVPIPDGEVGEIVVTSLMRVRNPFVRYRTGDIGFLHPYITDDEGNKARYQYIRLYGRHSGKSFHLNGEKFDVVQIEKMMKRGPWKVLEWQVILESDHTGQKEESVEFRVILEDKNSKECVSKLQAAIVKGSGECVTAGISVKAVEYADLEKVQRVNKIRKIIDRR